ncbi:LysR family transcriptional regulator [Azospirillum picis]|uniref:DNA-binding transcriptional LysR family regulator n=1 Tax=Azospirillum picis TaxID=488438 RepID=A0ABU0MMB3_9PROT|nr:LysR family transcriptional regulator [Azospirillum picis]MBP2300577.1 DNA-binding transcriptional LysR family regulator [Azospirillum picis]MDQ0534546.1 DNA-binding transcriptional LysR family regulator [Azospirillum picis]
MKPADFARIRAFLAVAETLSFSRAAEELGMTSSAISQTVKALEAHLGQQLFQRTTRTVTLTDAGLLLRERMRPALDEIDRALIQSRDAAGRPSGIVRIVSFRSAGEKFILPILQDLRRDLPEVTLDITLDDGLDDPVAGGFDLALRIGEVIARDMIALPLGGELRQIAVAAPDYLSRHGTPDHPRALLSHDCICWRWPGQQHPFPWEFFDNGRWFSITPSGGLIVNDKPMALQMALAGLGIAFCIEETVRSHIQTGRLVSLLEQWSAPFPGFYICYPRQRQMPAATRAVIERIRAGT